MMQTSPKPSISPLERRQNDSMDVKSPPPSSSGTHPVLDVINPDATGKKAEAFDQIQSRKRGNINLPLCVREMPNTSSGAA